jgi:hypothetical protein
MGETLLGGFGAACLFLCVSDRDVSPRSRRRGFIG